MQSFRSQLFQARSAGRHESTEAPFLPVSLSAPPRPAPRADERARARHKMGAFERAAAPRGGRSGRRPRAARRNRPLADPSQGASNLSQGPPVTPLVAEIRAPGVADACRHRRCRVATSEAGGQVAAVGQQSAGPCDGQAAACEGGGGGRWCEGAVCSCEGARCVRLSEHDTARPHHTPKSISHLYPILEAPST